MAQNKAANSAAHLVPERVASYNQAYPALLWKEKVVFNDSERMVGLSHLKNAS
jgi:hypothetical protein